jgi:porin
MGNGANYAVYGVADQEIYRHAGAAISAFVHAGFAPADLSFVDAYVDAGFNFAGFIPGRPIDVAGLAVAHSSVSDDFSRADQRLGNPPSTGETVIEATYEINLAPWWDVQPDFQYIINPSGVSGSRNAAVFGVRTGIAF